MEIAKKIEKLDDIDYQMTVLRNFMDEFYNKTVFRSRRAVDRDLPPSAIKFLFSFSDETQAYPIGELGERGRVKKSTMTDIVDRMEKDGIAERIRARHDRRVVKVRLTPKGRKLRAEFIRKRRAEFLEIFSQLDARETREFVTHLESAFKILQKIE